MQGVKPKYPFSYVPSVPTIADKGELSPRRFCNYLTLILSGVWLGAF
jgi:hypothetical protein